ncbi:MAG: Vitamin B12-binding protein precursor [Planctomycetes bacterium ADurb.Bin401]|nr:MAG: Vitamin B12-binding protein precursor [Planctomycetes bacterium ADurb.Bin401]
MTLKTQKYIFLFIALAAILAVFIFSLPRTNPVPASHKETLDRIVSLAPNITEILFELGIGDKIVGVSEFCNYPPEAQKIPRVGALLNPNYEAIIALRPDLVILLDEMSADKPRFDSIGIDTLFIQHDTIAEILDSILLIGNRTKRTKQAEKIVSDLKSRIRNIQTSVPDSNRPRVLISLGRNYSQDPSARPQNISIAGNDGFYSSMIEYAGGKNAYQGKIPFPVVSWESIISMNPQIIIDIAPVETKPTDADVSVQQWKNFTQVEAAKNDRIYVFTEDYTAIPGPRFILTLEKIARIINHDEPNDN